MKYDTLIDTISWFFFDLLFLGYVEDLHSGESFHLPGGLSWSVYVEVSEWHFLHLFSFYGWAGLILIFTRQRNTFFVQHNAVSVCDLILQTRSIVHQSCPVFSRTGTSKEFIIMC